LVIMNIALSIGVVVVIVGMLAFALMADSRAQVARTSRGVARPHSHATAVVPAAAAVS